MDRFADVRSLLALGPSRGRFAKLCQLLREWPESEGPEMAEAYVQEHIALWPSKVCSTVLKGNQWETLWERPTPRTRLAKRLILDQAPFRVEAFQAMLHQTPMPSIKRLDCQNVTMDQEDIEALLHTPFFPSLSALFFDVTWDHQTKEHLFDTLCDSPIISRLEAFSFKMDSANYIETPLLKFLSVPELTHLQLLELSQVTMTAECVRVLAHEERFSQLQRLLLDNAFYNDYGAVCLAEHLHLHQLQELILRQNRIGSDGARALGSSRLFTQLRVLDLTGHSIIPALCQALKKRAQKVGLQLSL